jgi:hypothetical protein
MTLTGKINSNIKSAIKYFADNLISKQLQQHISIQIKFVGDTDNYGEVEITDYNLRNQPRDFTFFIDKDISEEEKIRTIAHEMVHTKQYVYSELNEEMTIWRGKEVSEEQYQKYEDRPWEAEAYKLGDELYESYINTTR